MSTNHNSHNENRIHNISAEDKHRYTKALDKLLEHHHAKHPHDTEEHKSKRAHIEKVVDHAKKDLEKGKVSHEVKTFLETIEDDIHEAESSLLHIANLVALYGSALGFV